jgi:signal transduction histidine kinase
MIAITLAIALWLRSLENNLHDMTSVARPRVVASYEMLNNALGAGIGVLKYIESADPAYRAHVAGDTANFLRSKADYDKLAYSAQLQELGGSISKLFGEYQALSKTLMNTKDYQLAIFAELSNSLAAIDAIIDDKIQTNINPTGTDGPLKFIGISKLETEIAQVGTWLGNYQRTLNPADKERILEHAATGKKKLAQFKELHLTAKERQWAGELENHFAQGLSQVTEVAALQEAQRRDEERFLALLTQLDNLMDIHMRKLTEHELSSSQAGVQGAVERILLSAFILLGLGLPIALRTSYVVGKGILSTEDRIKTLLTRERDRGNRLRQLADAALTINTANSPDSVLGVAREEAQRIIGARNCLIHMQADGQPEPAGGLTATVSGHGGKTLGVIQVMDKLDGDEFTFVDEVLLKQLASMAGVAMENAHLFDELHQRDRRKDEFLAALGHELRNPLAPIGNALEILRLGQGNETTDAEARETIERQFRHLVRIVDDLLEVSRITLGKIGLRKERVLLSEVVQSAIETSRPLIEDHGHELTVTLPPDPVWLWADASRLTQSIANVLNNAAKFTPDHGRITLTAQKEGDHVAIKVHDNGIGIRPDMLPRVFDIFAQGDNALERTQGGLGIGLFMVKKLVEMQGGVVKAHSAGRGQGSEFVIRFPVAALEQLSSGARKEAGTRQTTASPARRVLVVDDNRDAAESLGTLLRIMGHEVRIAYDGPTALEAARAYRPDLVLLDIGLPGMHGYEVAQRIRHEPKLRKVILAAVTGWGQEEDRRRAREAGFDHHVTKPLNRATLERLLATFK